MIELMSLNTDPELNLANYVRLYHSICNSLQAESINLIEHSQRPHRRQFRLYNAQS
jgi:hypothetical protein